MRVHLMRCAKCREASSAMTEISRRLSPGQPEALDPALRSRILSSVKYTDSGQPLAVTANFRKRGYPALLLGGASVVALLLVVVMNSPRSGRPGFTYSDKSAGPAAESRMESKVSTPAVSAPGRAAVDLERQSQSKFESLNQYAPASPSGGSAASPAFEPPDQAKTQAATPNAPTMPSVQYQSAGKRPADTMIGDSALDKRQYYNGAPPMQQQSFSSGALKMDSPAKPVQSRSEVMRKVQAARPAKARARAAQRARGQSNLQAAPAASKSAK